MMDCKMHMFYWWGTELKNFLFEGYNITTSYGLLSTCVMLFTLAIFFEFMKVIKARLRQSELRKRQQNLRSICSTENESLIEDEQPRIARPTNKYVRFLNELILWSSQEILGYGLMLAVMMYNGYMTIAVALGAGVGYFLFGQTLLKINLENIAVKKESLCFTTCNKPENVDLLSESSSAATEPQTSGEQQSTDRIVIVHN